MYISYRDCSERGSVDNQRRNGIDSLRSSNLSVTLACLTHVRRVPGSDLLETATGAVKVSISLLLLGNGSQISRRVTPSYHLFPTKKRGRNG